MTWREIEHTADSGLLIGADSLDELVEECRQALYGLMFPTGLTVPSGGEPWIAEVTGVDLEDLLVSWLNELVYIYDAKSSFLLPSSVAVDRSACRLVVQGKLFPAPDSEISVKAVTYGGVLLKFHPSLEFRVYLDL